MGGNKFPLKYLSSEVTLIPGIKSRMRSAQKSVGLQPTRWLVALATANKLGSSGAGTRARCDSGLTKFDPHVILQRVALKAPPATKVLARSKLSPAHLLFFPMQPVPISMEYRDDSMRSPDCPKAHLVLHSLLIASQTRTFFAHFPSPTHHTLVTSTHSSLPSHSSSPPTRFLLLVTRPILIIRDRGRVTLHDVIQVLRAHRRVRKERPDEPRDFVDREVDEVAVVEKEEDVRL